MTSAAPQEKGVASESKKDTVDNKQEKWKCGTPYKHPYPLPKPDEDPWTLLLQPLLEKDNVRCQVWKDEVQNILIFAGLFSAVVTAFIIESYKTLQQDPVEILLIYLAAQSGKQLPSELSPNNFSLPTDISTRINVLWFLSLVLSLATVLIGIVSLQWLREHQRLHCGLEPQIAFSLHQMHLESLDRWLVPQTFTFLPLLLQAALVFFLLGVNDLLWHMNQTVAIWATIATGLTLSFLVITTVLPTLQALSLFLPWKRRGRPGAPCAYKSPQAGAFHYLISFFVRVIVYLFGKQSQDYLKISSRNLTSEEGRAHWLGSMPRGTGMLFRGALKESWLEHSTAWLFQRDFEYMSYCTKEDGGDSPTFKIQPIPLYDSIRGLLEAKHAPLSEVNTTAVDRCVSTILTANDGPALNEKPYARFIHRLSLTQPVMIGAVPPVPPEARLDNNHACLDDAILRLYSRNTDFDNVPSEARWRYIETCVRLTRWMYGGHQARSCESSMDPEILPIQWVAHVLLKTLDNDPQDIKELQNQVRAIVLRFFDRAMKANPSEFRPKETMDSNHYLGQFLSATATILTYAGDHTICDAILDTIDHSSPNSSYVYQAAFMFCDSISSRLQDVKSVSASLRNLIHSLYKYEASAKLRGSPGLRKPLIKHSSYSFERFDRKARSLGVEDDIATDDDVKTSTSHFGGDPGDCIIEFGAASSTSSLLTASLV